MNQVMIKKGKQIRKSKVAGRKTVKPAASVCLPLSLRRCICAAFCVPSLAVKLAIIIVLLGAGCRAESQLPAIATHSGSMGRYAVDSLSTAFTMNGRLRLQGTYICNQAGDTLQLRGMSSHGLQYRGNCYSDVALDTLVYQWGADIMRLSMYAQEGGYEDNPDYWDSFVDSLIQKLYCRGVYCIVDWHMLHPGDPNKNLALASRFFRHISGRHHNKGNILYEICNEPNNDDYPVTWSMIKRYAEKIIPVIRQNDPQSLIIVGTPDNDARPDAVIHDTLAFANILYTIHFYVGDKDESTRMRSTQKALEAGIAVFATEWGTQNGWGDGPNDFEKSMQWIRFMRDHKISWCNWNYSDSPLSGATWLEGTCPLGPWTSRQLKLSGKWIKAHLNNPPDSWLNMNHRKNLQKEQSTQAFKDSK